MTQPKPKKRKQVLTVERIVLTTFMGNIGNGGITFSADNEEAEIIARIGYKPWFACSEYKRMTLVLEIDKRRVRKYVREER